MKVNILVLSVMLCIAVASVHAQTFVETYGVPYRVIGGKQLQMDIQRPQPVGVPKPAVVFLCGNGWGYDRTLNREGFWYALDLANEHGYVAATVDYSSSAENNNGRPLGIFPAQVHDVKSAIRFLRANARQYDIDPARIGVIGYSSGGNLALLLGLTVPADGLEGQDDNLQYSSSVEAVVNLCGATDLVSWNKEPYVSAYLGGTLQEKPDQYRRASPLTYVKPGMAPVLTIHGDRDLVVSPDQALLLDSRMKEVGAPHTLIIEPGRGHTDEIDQNVWDFLDKALK
ncbi:MAG TPA: alpha/beta hydrolase [Spirochaetia bacterium]|nr:alpha/beta hydrolase [Spirochaetia bacterium]